MLGVAHRIANLFRIVAIVRDVEVMQRQEWRCHQRHLIAHRNRRATSLGTLFDSKPIRLVNNRRALFQKAHQCHLVSGANIYDKMHDLKIILANVHPRIHRLNQFICRAASVLVLTGCSPHPSTHPVPPRSVAELLVVPAAVRLMAGRDVQLSAQANDAAGEPAGGVSFKFVAVDGKLLRVSGRGLISSIGPAGTPTQVIVSCGSVEAQVNVTIEPSAPVRMEKVGGNDQRVPAGESPIDPLAVRLLDAWGNPVAGVPVVVEPKTKGVDGSDIVSGADGVADYVSQPLTLAGAINVKMYAKETPSLNVTFELHGLPGATSRIELLDPEPGAGIRGASTPSIAIRVSDAFDNPVPNARVVAKVVGKRRQPVELRTDAAGRATLEVPKKISPRRLAIVLEAVDVPGVRRRLEIDPARAAGR